MKTVIEKCKHCNEIIIECSHEEWVEFWNSKTAEIERHEIECKENPKNADKDIINS
jgi:hypothetical protein